MSRRSFGLAAICSVVLALPAGAHHSHGSYESTFIDLQGTISEVRLINPHSWVYVEVKSDSGEATVWAMESTGRSGLARIGVVAGYLNVGDVVKARCHPLRDGSPSCLLGFLQAADGSIKDWDGNGAEPEDDGFFDLKR